MALIEILGLDNQGSCILLAVFGTLLAVLLIIAIVVFVLVQKGMLHIKFTKASRTIFGKPKGGLPEVQKVEQQVVREEDLAPLKITVFDIKEERKKFETSQRSVIKSDGVKKSRKTKKAETESSK